MGISYFSSVPGLVRPNNRRPARSRRLAKARSIVRGLIASRSFSTPGGIRKRARAAPSRGARALAGAPTMDALRPPRSTPALAPPPARTGACAPAVDAARAPRPGADDGSPTCDASRSERTARSESLPFCSLLAFQYRTCHADTSAAFDRGLKLASPRAQRPPPLGNTTTWRDDPPLVTFWMARFDHRLTARTEIRIIRLLPQPRRLPMYALDHCMTPRPTAIPAGFAIEQADGRKPSAAAAEGHTSSARFSPFATANDELSGVPLGRLVSFLGALRRRTCEGDTTEDTTIKS